MKSLTDFYSWELEYSRDDKILAGADEVGRGCLAGPLVVAAVILPDYFIPQVRDSKAVNSEKKRQLLCDRILRIANWNIGQVEADEIDRIRISSALQLAFNSAVCGLTPTPDFVVTDYVQNSNLPIPFETIIKGDAKIYSIAAASIVAKVTRDNIMHKYDEIYPQYGFGKHKGYATKEHYAAIDKYGTCPIHREYFLRKHRNKVQEKSFLDE